MVKTTTLYKGTRRVVTPAASQSGVPLQIRERARAQWLVILTLIFSDILLAFLVWGGAGALQSVWGYGYRSEFADAGAVASGTVWIGIRGLLGLYPGYGLGHVEELRRQTYAVLAALAITSIFAFAFQAGNLLSRLLIALGFLGLLILAPLLRYWVKQGIRKVGFWGKPVAIIGAGKVGARLVRALRREWALGYRPVAVFDNRLAPVEGELEGAPYGGTLTDALELARKRKVDTAIFAMPHARHEYLVEFISQASFSFRSVIVVPKLLSSMRVTTFGVTGRDLGGTFGAEIKHNLLNPWARRTKRALDLFGVLVGGLLISPLLFLIVVLIKLDSSGPVFHSQRRPGAEGKYFYCWKFRTMRTDAERLLTELLRTDRNLRDEWEKGHKLRNDPRVTRIGAFLRKTSLDELPQLWNVLRGEMSLVGPRPMLVEEIPKYGEVYGLYRRVRPGITGLWQVSGRSDTDYKERVTLAAYYVRNWSVWLDFIILVRTVKSVLIGRGAV